MDTPGQTEGPARVSQARVVFGLVVMLVGALLLLDRLDWWGVRWDVPLWPWILIVLGLARLSHRPLMRTAARAGDGRPRGCSLSARGAS